MLSFCFGSATWFPYEIFMTKAALIVLEERGTCLRHVPGYWSKESSAFILHLDARVRFSWGLALDPRTRCARGGMCVQGLRETKQVGWLL